MNKSLFWVVLLLAAASAAAQPGSHWVEVQTPHFSVMTNANERDARHTAAQFERMRAVFHTIMPSASDDPASPIIVLALKDRKSMRTLEPEAYLAKNQLELAGLFVRSQDRNYVLVRLDAEGDHPFATVYHEYTHYMFRKYDEWMPLWLNEGLAEFYQNTQIVEKDVRLGQPSADDILYLRQQKLLPLTTLLAVDHDSPYYHDEQKGSVFYAESWALTHYLQINDKVNNTHKLRDYTDNLQKHQDSVTAAQNAFGDLNKLQKDLDGYVGGMSFKEFHLLTPVTFAEDSFQVRAVPEAEAEAVQGGVLVNVRRAQDAQAMLETALKADPNNALAHEEMGTLKFSEHDVEGAKKWYGEAVKLDSKSYLAHYYFAVMSLQAGEHGQDEAIEQSLQAAIKLNPRYAPAYDALAGYYSSRNEKLDEAHVMNLHAIQLEPETLAYRLNAANVLMQNHQPESAISVLKAAEPLAKTPEQKHMITEREDSMERFQKAMTRERRPAESAVKSTVTADGSGTFTISASAGDEAPTYPDGPPSGPQRTVSGVLKNVKCAYPAVLTLTLEGAGKPVSLYTNDYFKVVFRTANYEPTGDIMPCTGIEGMTARVVYGEVTDTRVAGQILAIELRK